MQLKIYKKSSVLFFIVAILDLLGIFVVFKYGDSFNMSRVTLIILYVLFSFILFIIYSYYYMNADRNYIRKAVSNGDVAMAKIKGGTYLKTVRDAKAKAVNFWKLNVTIYDNDMKPFDTTIIEKFSQHQTKIPTGFVYVTYYEGKPEDSLIIPNAIIASLQPYQELTADYEKALKPKYLNAYYNMGLIVQTYEDSLKEKKKWDQFDKEHK